MSKNCVDAVIELSHETNAPLTLIASRRQIETAELGGGYVNGWTTEDFAAYVRQQDPSGRVLLARDHGGPWQNVREVEQKLSLREAMESCKRSYQVDIASGFDVLHLDPSVDIHVSQVPQAELLNRLFELYEFCEKAARRYGRSLTYEIGTEEQSGEQQDIQELANFLQEVQRRCHLLKVPEPFFVVVQTGTKVKETRNVGNLSSVHRIRGIIPPEVQITQLVEACEEYGFHIKEHNTDYLSDDVLGWHPRVGIHAANVAPEFGVVETRALLRLCDEFGLTGEREAFLQLALESGKWQKWLLPNSAAADVDKAIIAGHYVFADPRFLDIKNRMEKRIVRAGVDVDATLRASLKHSIRRYLNAFNLLDR